jgi:hypothetical protein
MCRTDVFFKKYIFIMNFVIYIENLAPNGTASQSTDYYYNNKYYTADLAISGVIQMM